MKSLFVSELDWICCEHLMQKTSQYWYLSASCSEWLDNGL